MRAVEHQRRNQRQRERRAKPARRSIAFHSPRPPLLRGSTKESMTSKPKPSDGDFVAAIRGSVADAFFGASPVVASALGIRSGATPRGRHQRTTAPPSRLSKQDISTLLGIGHFYFALTPRSQRIAVHQRWASPGKDDPWGLVNDRTRNHAGWILDAKCVSPAAMPFGSFGAFVLPVFFLEKRYVHTPDERGPAALHTFGRVNRIAPDDVPPRVVVVRLDGPGQSRRLCARWSVRVATALSGQSRRLRGPRSVLPFPFKCTTPLALITRVVPFAGREESVGMAFSAIAKNIGSISSPILVYPTATAAAIVDPAPITGSSTVPIPSGRDALTIWRMNACGFSEGCGAILRSSARVGDDRITSEKGASAATLLSPPVFHLRRFSCTLPSHGFRNRPHGSQADRGITVTSENSLCAFFGRSPPRNVWTSLMISPRFSKPAAIRGA